MNDNETQSETVSTKKKKYKKVIVVFINMKNDTFPIVFNDYFDLFSFSIVCFMNRKKVQVILWLSKR